VTFLAASKPCGSSVAPFFEPLWRFDCLDDRGSWAGFPTLALAGGASDRSDIADHAAQRRGDVLITHKDPVGAEPSFDSSSGESYAPRTGKGRAQHRRGLPANRLYELGHGCNTSFAA